jgi:hypothetical protein
MDTELTEALAGLREVTLLLCPPCMNGGGGQCHSPGCSLYLNRAPDLPVTPPPAAVTPGRFLDSALAAARPHLDVLVATVELRDDGIPLLRVDGNLRASREGSPAGIRAAFRDASESVITAVEAAGIEFDASPDVHIGSGDGSWPEAVMRMTLVPPGTALAKGQTRVRHSASAPM